MNDLLDNDGASRILRDQIIGLGERSLRKSYFPQLQKQIDELRQAKVSVEAQAEALRTMLAALDAMRARVEESEVNYREIFQCSSEAIIVHDIQDGCVCEVNHAFEELYGYSAEEAVGLRIRDLSLSCVEGGDQQIAERMHAALQDGVSRFEWHARRKDGSCVWVDVTLKSATIRGEARMIASVRDISKRKRAEAELAEAHRGLEDKVAIRTAELEAANRQQATLLERLQNTQNQLVQSEKLAALGALVSGIAHELGTPVGNAVMVASTIAELGGDLDRDLARGTLRRSQLSAFLEAVNSGAQTMLRNLHRAAELVDSFKEIAVDRASSRRRQFDLRDVMRETEVALAPSLRHANCRLDVDIQPGIKLDSFPGPLGQVIGNLVSNSIMHGFEGRQGGTMAVLAEEAGDNVWLVFSDDGVGISEENLPKIFDPFFTTKLGHGGSGLGLHIVYNIVSGILGGSIHATSKPGEGATFCIAIPKVAPPCKESG